MISMLLRRLYFCLSYLTGFPQDLRPGMQGLRNAVAPEQKRFRHLLAVVSRYGQQG